MEQQELYLMLGRIEGKLDGLAQRLEGNDQRVTIADHRVGRLENRVSYWGGGLALIVFVATFFQDAIAGLFTR